MLKRQLTHRHYILQCSAVHCSALQCIVVHCIYLFALHCIALHCIALHCIALHCIALHCIAYYKTTEVTWVKDGSAVLQKETFNMFAFLRQMLRWEHVHSSRLPYRPYPYIQACFTELGRLEARGRKRACLPYDVIWKT